MYGEKMRSMENFSARNSSLFFSNMIYHSGNIFYLCNTMMVRKRWLKRSGEGGRSLVVLCPINMCYAFTDWPLTIAATKVKSLPRLWFTENTKIDKYGNSFLRWSYCAENRTFDALPAWCSWRLAKRLTPFSKNLAEKRINTKMSPWIS